MFQPERGVFQVLVPRPNHRRMYACRRQTPEECFIPLTRREHDLAGEGGEGTSDIREEENRRLPPCTITSSAAFKVRCAIEVSPP